MWLLRRGVSADERNLTSSFASWLVDIGDGKTSEPDQEDLENTNWIDIPLTYCLPDDEQCLLKLIDFIYDQMTLRTPYAITLQEKANLCPKNETADIINSKVLEMVQGETTTHLSHDEGRAFLCLLCYVLAVLLHHDLGCVRAVGDLIPFGDPNITQSKRRKIEIENLKKIIELMLWDETIEHFKQADFQKMEQPVIIAVCSCRVSKYRDYQLAASPATYYYLNPNIPESQESRAL
nr:nucleic acid-binding, OB-fold protein [Tanacetum cinerariifolium]